MMFATGFSMRAAALSLAVSGVFVGGVASAQGVRIDTTAIDAVSTMQFSYDAYETSFGQNVIFGSGGNAVAGPGMSTTADGGHFAPSFYLPITNIVLSPTLFNLTNVASGDAIGSALTFTRMNATGTRVLGGFELSDFRVNYNTRQVEGNFIANGQSTYISIYNFTRQSSLTPQFSATGGLLGLQLHEVLGNLKLTTGAPGDGFDAATSFADALGFCRNRTTAQCATVGFRDALAGFDFGTLTQDINIGIRSPVSDAAYTRAAMVPESGTMATMMVGLLGLGLAVRRRRQH